MKVLHVVPTFYPATYWGGPIWSTKAICDGIASQPDVELRVLTGDANGPRISDRVTPAKLPYPVHYAYRVAGNCMAPGLLARLPAAIHWADVVHLTGTYNMPTLPVFALAGFMNKPVVWSPRGALLATQDWADAPKKRLKESFEKFANMCLPRRSILHVTAASEAEGSTKNFPKLACAIIPNSVPLPDVEARQANSSSSRRLMFLSRLHPKKGLDVLLDAMERLPESYTLDIYGSGDADYTNSIAQRALRFGGRVRLHGHVDGEAKARAFMNADLFVLPSFSENFGIVVAEALAHQVPVLTTQATPWANLDAQECGRCVALNEVDLAAEIEALCTADLPALGQRGRAWMARDYSPAQMVDAFERLYRGLISSERDRVLA